MTPLSEKIRPKSLNEVAGQSEILQVLSKIIESKKPLSLLFYGPPGSGKTTLARIYASSFDMPHISISGVFNSTSELRKILNSNQETPLFQRPVLVFVDEIHRFNKAQQDLFLPFIENGNLILVGATTENPSFVLNNALLSRLRCLKLEALTLLDFEKIIERCEKIESPLSLSGEEKMELIKGCGGDARFFLNQIENLYSGFLLKEKSPLYDRHQDMHFNLISALHKSVRGSDPDAALYWLARMLHGGEDPNYIARRLIRMAVEDIGLSDPNALHVAISASQAYHMLGSPEGELALAEAAVYLSLCPKSVSLYRAYGKAKELAEKTGHMNPPKHILNAPTRFMKKEGCGQGYQYDPDAKEGVSSQTYFPKELNEQSFYSPIERGFERELKKRLLYFSRLRQSNL